MRVVNATTIPTTIDLNDTDEGGPDEEGGGEEGEGGGRRVVERRAPLVYKIQQGDNDIKEAEKAPQPASDYARKWRKRMPFYIR